MQDICFSSLKKNLKDSVPGGFVLLCLFSFLCYIAFILDNQFTPFTKRAGVRMFKEKKSKWGGGGGRSFQIFASLRLAKMKKIRSDCETHLAGKGLRFSECS